MSFPGRPDHPDFWLISETVIEQDAQSEQGQRPQEILGRMIDPESAIYAAMQRAVRLEKAAPPGRAGRQAVAGQAARASLWLDGFLTGMRVQQKKTARQDAGTAPVASALAEVDRAQAMHRNTQEELNVLRRLADAVRAEGRSENEEGE